MFFFLRCSGREGKPELGSVRRSLQQTLPPCASTIVFAIASPRPVPSNAGTVACATVEAVEYQATLFYGNLDAFIADCEYNSSPTWSARIQIAAQPAPA